MSNFNMSAIQRIVNNLGLQAQLIPSAVQPRTCIKVIVNGVEFKSSNWTKAEAEAILTGCKEGCTKQDLKDLNNMTFETIVNPIDELKKFIDFENKSLTSCLEGFRELTEKSSVNALNHWINTMTDFFTNEISNKADTTACANKIKNMFDTKQVRLINGYVYSNSELTNVIKTWQDINNVNANINYNMAIDKYINAVESL